jgi:cell division septum initiation protein DivIVA
MTVTSRAELSRAEQRLTPDVVQAVSFRSAHLGRRGFDEEHVRAFCHQVQDELVRLLSERTALQEEVNRLRRRIVGHSAEDDGFGYSRADAHLQAVSILYRAQQTADHYVAEAQEYSRHLAQDAQRRRDDMLAEARAHANRVMDEAHHEAGQAAQAAMAAQMEMAAQTAMATPGAPAEPPADRRELEAELAYLRTFSDVYRTHLRAYLDALIRDVSEFEQAEKPPAAATRPDLPACPGSLPQEL